MTHSLSTKERVWATLHDGTIDIISLNSKYLEKTYELLVDEFFTQETYSQITGISKNYKARLEILETVKPIAEKGLSLIAVHRATDEVLAASFQNLRVINENTDLQNRIARCTQEESKVYLSFKSTLNVFKILDTDCYIEILFGITKPSWRNLRLSHSLKTVALDLSRRLAAGETVQQPLDDNNIVHTPFLPKYAFSVSTSPASRRVSENLGFKAVQCIPFAEFFSEFNNCKEREGIITFLMIPLDKN